MENSTIQSAIDFQNFITNNLTYPVISKMSFIDYKKFVFKLFEDLNYLRNQGLKRDDISNFVNTHYSRITEFSDDADILFERRFSGITEELIGFCSDPIFWYSDFSIYKRKWERVL
ncbi:hypothetical protein GOQ30_16990 [Flavobacterium sp. TP390]|uniref:Uncharacterized protein n=1 Tax=Flavobacterium profundi TaxID=1774945 RepID=A0A6I4IVL0_9FLAO|nr:hypothetical protein [Flavobacterium profundi]MVO10870.1 hypothetical protein [Flavobacterium profundi]